MGFDTIIVNGRVATATDTYTSDVAISHGKISAVGQSLPRDNATQDHRRRGQVRISRRNRRAYPPRHAFRRHDQRG
jgi:predicted amidohydrolase YtcJ